MSKEFSGYKVSQQTAAYLDALKSLEAAHNAILKAIYENNETQTAQDHNEQIVLELINPINRYLWEMIEQSITDNLLVPVNSTGDLL